MKAILVASHNQSTLNKVDETLKDQYEIYVVQKPEDCLLKFCKRRFEFAFIDVTFLDTLKAKNSSSDYREVLKPYQQAYPQVPIILLAVDTKTREAVNFVRAGAADYLNYPIDPAEIKLVMETVIDSQVHSAELDYFRDKFWSIDAQEVVWTKNKAMNLVYQKIKSVAATRANVLLVAETGTGKGLLARLIHEHSNRSDKQFISIHCGAIPDNLVESELFGHEKGAFTGATQRKLGKFEVAKDGTIFLDEVATMPISSQVKLLQVLQDKIFQRVGGTDNISSDARVIAASNTNLEELSKKGDFRLDLYYRLNVFPIEVPPLRERVEDIPLLVNLFLKRLNKIYTKEILDVDPAVFEALARYGWPGNIRELENLIERAYILEPNKFLTQESFPSDLFTFQATAEATKQIYGALTLAEVRNAGVANIERRYLKELLAAHKGKIAQTAKVAGISTRQLHKLLAKYDICKQDFKFLPPIENALKS